MRYMGNAQKETLESLTLASVCATDFLCGIVETTAEQDGWARPQRFGARQRRALSSCLAWHPGQFRQMAAATSGVCLRFATDSTTLALAVRLDEEPPATRATLKGCGDEPQDGLSLEVDGQQREVLQPRNDLLIFMVDDSGDGFGGATMALPGLGTRHEVCLWLPCLRGCTIRELWADGTYVEPLPPRPRLLVLGDELAQGYCCGDPACTWPALMARDLELELVNQSVAGQVFQPSSILDAQVDNVTKVVVELGANYVQERCDKATVAADVRGFMSEVARHWPQAEACVITPTWQVSRGCANSCYREVGNILARAARTRGAQVVDGRKMVAEGLVPLPSGAEVLDFRASRRFATRLLLSLDMAGASPQELRERALSVLAHEPICALPLREAIRRNIGEVVVAREGCVVLALPNKGCVLYATSGELAEESCGLAEPPRYYHVLGSGIARQLGAHLALDDIEPYNLCVYENEIPLPISPRLAAGIRPLGESHLAFVLGHYEREELVSTELLREALRRGRFLGAFAEGEIVGYIGEHPEGSIGMLHVLREFRRCGWGEALERAQINRCLQRGEIPWVEVSPKNRVSLRLQKKLGLTVVSSGRAGYVSGGRV